MGLYKYNGEILKPATNRFRVCAFNVGNFSLGQSGDPDGTDEMYNDFLETFRQCMADVYMFSEWDVNYNSDETSASVFSYLKPHHTTYIKTGAGEYAGQMTYSDYAMSSEHHEDFVDGTGGNYFVDNVIEIKGYEIHFICTHLTWKTEAWRDSQIEQILDYISTNDITYYIIGGDMNLGLHGQDGVPDTQELRFEIARRDVNLLESEGAVSLQGGTWGLRDKDGFFNTAGSLGWDAPNTNMFDNMAVSPNIRIRNVFVVVSDASDHNALCADLEISG